MLANLAGIFSLRNHDFDRATVERMVLAMPHPGDSSNARCVGVPDGELVWAPIVPSTQWGEEDGLTQCPNAGLVVALDGRIDNAASLAEELKVPNGPASKLIAAGYRVWQEEILRRLEGDFAVAIHDAQRPMLLLARDRMTARPLYWATNGVTFVFASYPLGVVRGLAYSMQIDSAAVHREVLGIPTLAPKTMHRQVSAVTPHEYVEYSRGRVRSKPLSRRRPAFVQVGSDAEFVEQYRERLLESVRTRLGDVRGPAAFSLSGGLDSSVVVCLARHVAPRRQDMTAFTLAQGTDSDRDLPYAQDVVTMSQVPWICVPAQRRGVCDDLARAAHNPFAAALTPFAWELFTAVRAGGRRHLFLGALGDSVGGYAGNWQWRVVQENGASALNDALAKRGKLGTLGRLRTVLGVLRRSTTVQWSPVPLLGKRLGPLDGPTTRGALNLIAASRESKRRLLRELWDQEVNHFWWQTDYRDMLCRHIEVGAALELSNWDLVARVVGVEPYYPLAAESLASLSPHAPLALCRQSGLTRVLLRQATGSCLPESVCHRQEKLNHSAYFRSLWMREVQRVKPQDLGRLDELIDLQVWGDLAANFDRLPTPLCFALYSCLVLERWLKLND